MDDNSKPDKIYGTSMIATINNIFSIAFDGEGKKSHMTTRQRRSGRNRKFKRKEKLRMVAITKQRPSSLASLPSVMTYQIDELKKNLNVAPHLA